MTEKSKGSFPWLSLASGVVFGGACIGSTLAVIFIELDFTSGGVLQLLFLPAVGSLAVLKAYFYLKRCFARSDFTESHAKLKESDWQDYIIAIFEGGLLLGGTGVVLLLGDDPNPGYSVLWLRVSINFIVASILIGLGMLRFYRRIRQ